MLILVAGVCVGRGALIQTVQCNVVFTMQSTAVVVMMAKLAYRDYLLTPTRHAAIEMSQ
jgi:hypothetical protein